MVRWLVVGLSGVTCSGKTYLAQLLHHTIPAPSAVISQDEFFYPKDSSHHVPAPCGIGHHNWEVISAIDMGRMLQDVRSIVGAPPVQWKTPAKEEQDLFLPWAVKEENPYKHKPSSDAPRAVLLIEGFLLFGHSELIEECDLRYFLTLTQERCWERRQTRHYDPPDPPGYFQQCVWPEYQKHLNYVRELDGIRFLDGMVALQATYQLIFDDIVSLLEN